MVGTDPSENIVQPCEGNKAYIMFVNDLRIVWIPKKEKL